MLRLLTFWFALALAAAAAAQPSQPNFDHDATKPPPPIAIGPERHTEFQPFEDGRAVSGEVFEGMGRGPHPAVLFVHWLGDPATTNHTEFEADARALAVLGVTSLLIDASWSKKGWFGALGASADADIRASEDEVVDLRRSLDLLLGQPGVDRTRVAYVGHDFGAMFGMMLASVDTRPNWYVFMTPNSSVGEWYLWEKKTPDRDAYLARLSMFDLANFAPKVRAKGVLFQFSRRDEYVTREHAQAIYDATPHPKTLQWFDADHGLAADDARLARIAWLEQALGVGR